MCLWRPQYTPEMLTVLSSRNSFQSCIIDRVVASDLPTGGSYVVVAQEALVNLFVGHRPSPSTAGLTAP